MPLNDQPILIVETAHFAVDLHQAIQRAGADVILARDTAGAERLLGRFKFAACIVGAISDPDDYVKLIAAVAGMPLLCYAPAPGGLNAPAPPLAQDVVAIVRALEDVLK